MFQQARRDRLGRHLTVVPKHGMSGKRYESVRPGWSRELLEEPMADMSGFWKAWAPYWRENENRYLDATTVRRLEPNIVSPVLIVGAGQGLLVAQLRKDGFQVDGLDSEPAMVAYAKKRRGIDLIHADGRNTPFSDESYATVVISTGVIDFIDDKEAIRSILKEAIRVVHRSGKVLIAFHKMREDVALALADVGCFTEDSRHYRMRTMVNTAFESPKFFVMTMRADIGLWRALLALLKLQFLPRKQIEALAHATPDLAPYRTPAQIRQLFDEIGTKVKEFHVFETCTVVEVAKF